MIAIETLACAGLVTGLFLLLISIYQNLQRGCLIRLSIPDRGSGKNQGIDRERKKGILQPGDSGKHRKCLN